MNFGLKEQVIEEIKKVFNSNTAIDKAIIYGSRAKGNFKPGSDIDIVLIAPKLSLRDLYKIENQLDDLLLPWKIDLILMHNISNHDLIDHINRVGITFYERRDNK
jgi:uncharacterized protein